MRYSRKYGYEYATYSTKERAESALEDMFARDEICAAEDPQIERRTTLHHKTYFAIVLPLD